jgi:hypothetical protein
MTHPIRAAALALAIAIMPAAAAAETVLGKVETLYVALSRDLLIEFTPGMRTHDRPLVADVRLRDAAGQVARHVFLRLDGDAVEAGDVVAVTEDERGRGMRTGSPKSRARLARVEAKFNTDTARDFFRATPKFLALGKAD